MTVAWWLQNRDGAADNQDNIGDADMQQSLKQSQHLRGAIASACRTPRQLRHVPT
jgi:hypothetical protein